MMALAVLGRLLDNISPDLATTVIVGSFLTAIINRYVELEKASFSHWLLQFNGFKEILLADNLFLVMIALECGVPFQVECALEALSEEYLSLLDATIVRKGDVALATVNAMEEYLTIHDGELGEIGIACQI
ncbi:hypothetical protein SUGI_0127270 [Cryptomeria japonica]|nr:hypothetical protein SUGI_0127270 [Cryptomeria japonica]